MTFTRRFCQKAVGHECFAAAKSNLDHHSFGKIAQSRAIKFAICSVSAELGVVAAAGMRKLDDWLPSICPTPRCCSASSPVAHPHKWGFGTASHILDRHRAAPGGSSGHATVAVRTKELDFRLFLARNTPSACFGITFESMKSGLPRFAVEPFIPSISSSVLLGMRNFTPQRGHFAALPACSA